MVVWIIGLSGAGKSALAEKVVALVRQRIPNVALLDGDLVREALGHDLGHTAQDRKKNADRLCGLGKLLDDQGIHVVCAVLSLFPESREWNRKHLKNYYEVYVKTPLDSLARRDAKGLYQKALAGEIELPGVNMDFPEPERPDLAIHNDGSLEDLLGHAVELAERICVGHV